MIRTIMVCAVPQHPPRTPCRVRDPITAARQGVGVEKPIPDTLNRIHFGLTKSRSEQIL